jgi:inner membrane protein
MASAVTHAVVGASIGLVHAALAARADRIAVEAGGAAALAPPPPPAWRLVAGSAVVACLPDADVLAHHFVDYAHPFGHRGAFHSPLFYLLSAGAVSLLAPRRRALVFSSLFFAMLSHSLLDMLTDGGLGVAMLYPLSSERFFFPWRPIPVSPLSVGAFIGERGLRVLSVELPFFALPALGVGLGARAALRRGASRSRA